MVVLAAAPPIVRLEVLEPVIVPEPAYNPFKVSVLLPIDNSVELLVRVPPTVVAPANDLTLAPLSVKLLYVNPDTFCIDVDV